MNDTALDAAAERSIAARRRRRRRRPIAFATWQLALIGLVGAALNLMIVRTSLAGLHRVNDAYEAIGQVVAAQRSFQHADMLHDTLEADVLMQVLRADTVIPGLAQGAGATTVDAATFLADLDAADAHPLTEDLHRQLRTLRPLQGDYAATAVRVSSEAQTSPADATRDLPVLLSMFTELEGRQAEITSNLTGLAAQTDRRAAGDESTAQAQMVASAGVALAGFLVMAFLLGRQGRRLAEHASRERGVAETLQHSLLPDRLPDLPGVALAARYVAGGTGVQVGGDWYDVIPLAGGDVGLVMGDVVGHDLGAAAVMGQMRNALRAYAAEATDPGQVLERLNRMCHQQRTEAMSTCLYAVLDPVASCLTVANAGHYPPLLVAPGAEAAYLEQPAYPPIGAVREQHYPVTVYPLQPGSSVLFFTDGLVERRRHDVQEGLDWLRREAAAVPAGLEAFCDHLLAGLMEAGTPQDDVALLLVAPAARLGPRLDLMLPADPSRLVDLRRVLTRWLLEAGADDAECYEVTVAVSEAATNAIEHAYGPGDATYRVTGEAEPGTGRLRLVVQDWGRWRSPRGRDRGRGLHLMEGLMDTTRVVRGDATSGGTTVELNRRLALLATSPPPLVRDQASA